MPARSRSKSTKKSSSKKEKEEVVEDVTEVELQNAFKAAVWDKLFESIDVDKSGFIDHDEICSALHHAYPSLKFTYNDITSMITEADSNHDGLIDRREFHSVMKCAHDKNDLWNKVKPGMFDRFKSNLLSTANAVDSTIGALASPFHHVTGNHVHIIEKNGEHFPIPSIGMRIIAVFYLYTISLLIEDLTSPNEFMGEPRVMNNDYYYYVLVFLTSRALLNCIGFAKGKTIECWIFGWRLEQSQGVQLCAFSMGLLYAFDMIINMIFKSCSSVFAEVQAHGSGNILSMINPFSSAFYPNFQKILVDLYTGDFINFKTTQSFYRVVFEISLLLLTGKDILQFVFGYEVVTHSKTKTAASRLTRLARQMSADKADK